MIKQGETYWVKIGKQETQGQEIKKTRLAVVITNDEQNAKSKVIIVVPLSTSVHKIYAYQVPVLFDGKKQKVKCEQLKVISIKRLGKNPQKIGSYRKKI
jgi:mRNA interferase MazF